MLFILYSCWLSENKSKINKSVGQGTTCDRQQSTGTKTRGTFVAVRTGDGITWMVRRGGGKENYFEISRLHTARIVNVSPRFPITFHFTLTNNLIPLGLSSWS
uniref:Uncharacterized protein n=1 Tax=Sipha flava TaxID=143950 RepID=A0A2S2Q999_9HEMI